MSLSEKGAALLTAMHAAAGARELLTAQWIELAQKHDAVATALRAAFGKRMPTPQRLGMWLTERLGATVGELTLHGKHSARAKAWRYAVRTAAETTELERQAAEAAAAKEAKAAAIRERAEKTVEARLAAVKTKLATAEANRAIARELTRKRLKGLGVNWQPPDEAIPPAPEPLPPAPEAPKPESSPRPELFETVTGPDSEGRITRKPVLGRDGQPLRSKSPPPEPQKPAEVKKPTTRVEEMRARYLAHHSGVGLSGGRGFADPYGIVSHNINAQSGTNFCKVAGKWPGRG